MISNYWKCFVLLALLSQRLLAQNDLKYLEITCIPNFSDSSIAAMVYEHWLIEPETDSLKLGFFPDYKLDSIISGNQKIPFHVQIADSSIRIPTLGMPELLLTFFYSGKPHQAKNAPWDGGFVWSKTTDGSPWLGLACQNIGAKLWWPAPTQYSDKPENVKLTCIYPDTLFFKGNGKLISDTSFNNKRITTWETTYPINTYNITLNISKYGHWSDSLVRENSSLKLDFFPLKNNLEVSKRQFNQAKPMLKCFESAFGNYPYQEDGYSVVETDYAGMEHQSCIAYGNGYMNGYAGKDYSGMNLPFDFILIHESAHEWWGNSISAKEPSDFWLQEAFCTYAEMVYVDCVFGSENALKYINLKKALVKNEVAILSPENHDADMYSKGALMIHSLSNFLTTKEEWKVCLRNFYQNYAGKSITSNELFNWFSVNIPNCSPEFFIQYLSVQIPPVLSFKQLTEGDSTSIDLKIVNGIDNFKLPLTVKKDDGTQIKVIVSNNLNKINLPKGNYIPDDSSSYFILEK
jgi:aminopeptidase N